MPRSVIMGRTIAWSTMGELADAKAAEFGDKVFAEISGQPLTYADLNRRSLALARNLVSRGVRPGDRVATLLHSCVEQVLTCFGVQRAGAIWVPINSALRGADLTHTLADSGSRILILEEETREQFDGLDPALRVGVEVFSVDGGGRYPSFDELLADRDAELPFCEASTTGAILYTGGTTGLPKGVLHAQFFFILGGIRYGEAFEVRAGERHFTVLPLYHAGCLHWGLMGPLVSDMTTVIDRRFSASRYFERVRETGANVIDPFGAAVTMIVRQPPSELDRKHAVRISVGVNHNLPPGTAEAFESRFGIPMLNVWGLTEGGGNITSNRVSDPTPNSNGRTHGWAEARIVDDAGVVVPFGTVGEIQLHPTFPHQFMQGYHDAPEQTSRAWQDGWLRTGDLGSMDEDGNLFFVGRKAHWIRRRGENISAYEIEAVLSGHPDISEAVVVGVPSELGEDDIKAFIVARPNATRDPARIVDWLSTRLAPFKNPRYVEFVDDFPRSATKREVERSTLKARSNAAAWDREMVMGRLSGQARMAPNMSAGPGTSGPQVTKQEQTLREERR